MMKSNIKAVSVILGWAVGLDAFTLWAIFQGLLLPQVVNGGGLQSEVLNGNPIALGIFYSGILGTSVLAALAISDLGRAVISFFASYLLAAILNVIILALPDFTGAYNDPLGVLVGASVTFTFFAFFPLSLIAAVGGTLFGSAVAERYL
jgi:hypothetical protein